METKSVGFRAESEALGPPVHCERSNVHQWQKMFGWPCSSARWQALPAAAGPQPTVLDCVSARLHVNADANGARRSHGPHTSLCMAVLTVL